MSLAPPQFLSRSIQDAGLKANIAAPNANATTFSTFIDFGAPNAAIVNERVSLVANIPNIANAANTKTILLTVEDADANANANAASLGITATLTAGASGVGAQLVEFRLPGRCRQFVRLRADGGANLGTTLTETATAELRT
jgi:hypothetical protein